MILRFKVSRQCLDWQTMSGSVIEVETPEESSDEVESESDDIEVQDVQNVNVESLDNVDLSGEDFGQLPEIA